MAEEDRLSVSIVIIPHNNQERFKTLLARDLLPTLTAHPAWKFQVIVIDNSDDDKRIPCDILDSSQLCYVCKRPGANIMYGPAMNLAVQTCEYPYLVYLCSNHGHMYDPTWIDDLVIPLTRNDRIAMTGSQYPSGDPAELGFPQDLPQCHIQGGIFGARTEALLKYPYTMDERYIHWGSDVYQGFQLLNAGFILYDVPSINSVWRQKVDTPEKWKYVHDYSE